MRSTIRRRSVFGIAVAGALIGFLVGAAVTGAPEAAAPATVSAPPPNPSAASTTPPTPTTSTTSTTTANNAVLLAWTSGGLPPGLADRVRPLAAVDAITTVRGDQADLVASSAPDGAPIDELAAGWRIPLDVIAVDPPSFSTFLTGPSVTAVARLQPGHAILTKTSARLRRLGPGSTIRLTAGTVIVAAVIDDASGAGAELIVHADDAAELGVATERYLLARHHADRAVVQQQIADLAGPGHSTRFRTPAETTWLRHGDAVAPQAHIKAAYGEFAYRDRGGRDIEIDHAWVDRWIVTEDVPVLGAVTCHRRMIEPLRAAMAELSRTNLDHLVSPAQFAGCWGPRRIGPGLPVSRHAWGIAVDLNVDDNPRGSFSTQDPRLVEVMRNHGLGWGGTWLVPDPAHYEVTAPSVPDLGRTSERDPGSTSA